MGKEIHRKKNVFPICDSCKNKKCSEGKDCFGETDQILPEYTEEDLRLFRVASRIEGVYYMQKTRLEEMILFSHEMGFKKLGIAFCIGLSEEAKLLSTFLRRDFKLVSVCCKACGISKDVLGLRKINSDLPETMCNPIGQAILLNKAQTDFNIICGLCIGHDILFANHSKAPVTTFIVKDRILAHNTAAFLYCRYLRKRIGVD